VHLHRAHLHASNLQEAFLGKTVFEDTDLREVRGLDTCRHQGTSHLDAATRARSGTLPESFLQGCG
jgi:hypothetical protein